MSLFQREQAKQFGLAKITKKCKNLSLFSTFLPLSRTPLPPSGMATETPFRGENGRGIVARFPRAAREWQRTTAFLPDFSP